jgi:hypothetical protein
VYVERNHLKYNLKSIGFKPTTEANKDSYTAKSILKNNNNVVHSLIRALSTKYAHAFI